MVMTVVIVLLNMREELVVQRVLEQIIVALQRTVLPQLCRGLIIDFAIHHPVKRGTLQLAIFCQHVDQVIRRRKAHLVTFIQGQIT